MAAALLIIDVQEAFIGNRRGERQFEETMDVINWTASLFRSSGKPVVIIRDVSEGNGAPYENVPELSSEPGDIEITKKHGNGFWKTPLEKELRDLDVDFVVLCGNAAEHCVLATHNGANERGFVSAILQGGVFAEHDEGLLDLFRNRSLISYAVIEHMLGRR